MNLNTPLSQLKNVGAATVKRLAAVGLATAGDLLWRFPYRYDDFTHSTKIADLRPEIAANIIGQIELIQNRHAHHRRMFITEAIISDGSEKLKVIWFNQPFIGKTLKIGDTISLAGIAEDQGILTMVSPVYEKVGSSPLIHTAGLIPIYHLTEKVTGKQLRFFISQAIVLSEELPEILPQEMLRRLNLLPIAKAIKLIHFPQKWADVDAARKRLAFNEIFLLQLKSQLVKKEREKSRAEAIEFKEKDTKDFVSGLPFKLTDDQRRAAWTILGDLSKTRPMSRLLNGDVGSGKTVVAAIALLNVALNGKQGVLMAPTEILAQQHFNTLAKLFKNFPLRIGLLTNNYKLCNEQKSETNTSKAEIIKMIKAGEIGIIIGTHALIQENVKFKNLSLVAIDEQHRFGVEQRQAILEKSNKGLSPHLLSMTATPIPRSLALALFGDLNISVIRQMPSGRQSIITKVVPEEKRTAAYDFIRQEISTGRQAFVICPLIEESDFFGMKSVKEEFAKLDKAVFPEIKMAALHGKMKAKEKEEIMRGFLSGEYKILVSTSVVEVGIDVPNATIMLIEGADRFGLAQLHQFRGRVGRGGGQSYCFLFSSSADQKSLERLKVMEKTADGFTLAKTDLKLRGSGEIFGTAQSGFPELKIATLWDYELMQEAQKEAINLLASDPEFKKNPALGEKMKDFENKTHLE
jgi:ATP-dependent DNA helicase RecG